MRTRRYVRVMRAVLWLLLVAPGAFAQEPSTEVPATGVPATDGPATRADAIGEARADKVAELWPERQSPLVNTVNGLVERGFKEGIDSGRGVNGPQIVVGGMRPGQGFTAGVGYRRSDLWHERIGYRATARGTFQKAYLFDFDLDFQGIRTERTSLRWYTKFESSPDIDYYGPGNESPEENHTSFAYDDLTSDFDAAYLAFRHIRLGFTGGYLHARSARGHDDFPPIDEIFTPDEIPGFGQDTHYTRIGAFVHFDFRDSTTGPRRGGLYGMRYREYWDVDRKTYAFRQTEWEFQQYVPYFNGGRVVAMRAALVLSYPKEGNQLPLYLQPVLGGNDDLRGFGGYRFRDNHSLYLGAEHRWYVTSNLEMAAFVDAGKVVPLKRDAVEPTSLNVSGGFGFRVRSRSAIVSRTDFAFSREGFRVILDFQRHLQTQVVGLTTSFRRMAVAIAIVSGAAATTQGQTTAPRFYSDDPLRTEPVPLPVENVQPRALSGMLERANNTFKTTGQRHPPNGVIPAGGVNSLGEVMDGDWYVNRHATRRMTLDELRRGAGDAAAPATQAPWQLLVVKPYGVNPGLLIADAKNDLYLLRFDPLDYEGLATGAEMVTSRFLYALGYHVAENYLVRFERSQLVPHEEGQAVSSAGRTRGLLASDIDAFLRRVPLGAGRTYRAAATRLPDRRVRCSARSRSGARGVTTPTTPSSTSTGATCVGCSCSRPGSTTAT